MSSTYPVTGSPRSNGLVSLVAQLQAENERLKSDLARVKEDSYCQRGKPLFTIHPHKHSNAAPAAAVAASSSSSSSSSAEHLKAPVPVSATVATSTSSTSNSLAAPSPPGVIGSPSLSAGHSCVGVVVLGASGDLALKKTYPALYSLYLHELLPKEFFIVGYARSHIELNEFRKKISAKFPKSSDEQKNTFLSHCYYVSGQYDKLADFAKLHEEINKLEAATGAKTRNRVFYFAIPPNIFFDVAKGIAGASMSNFGWNRVIVEKPFGRDSDSSALLNRQIMSLFAEDQIYRIDHYLGKEMVQNLMVLRFANKVFEPLWNHNHIQCVMITFKEDFGTQGRGGYFDNFGIIRDVMQNHLFQILSLVGMNAPVTLNAEDVRDEKVKLLRAIRPLQLEDLVIGQYGPDPKGKETSYLQDPTVPKDSITPTFATAVFHIHNERWAGTPFILKCGKALNERKAEIRVQFRQPLNNLFEELSNNELVLRVQPDEAVYLKMSAKKPGLQGGVTHTELDLSYKQRFAEAKSLPDAYERLIYDVIRGDHNLFVRADELVASWAIFTPVLNRLEREKIKPLPYEYGSRGPKEADDLAYKYGFNRTVNYKWLDSPLTK